jgi:3-deoxy-D-manno-octulosonate 8-phosphate phosphatase (KDO 8-P phosphatase)
MTTSRTTPHPFQQLSQAQQTTLRDKIQSIQLMVFDVDGVLTDGRLYYDAQGEALKVFHVQDGLGLQLLQRSGIQIGWMTGRKSNIVEKRAADLKINHLWMGVADKYTTLSTHLAHTGLDWQQVGFMGDDWIDLRVGQSCGVFATVSDAVPAILSTADYVTHRQGGQGAVREWCELMLHANHQYNDIMKNYTMNPSKN